MDNPKAGMGRSADKQQVPSRQRRAHIILFRTYTTLSGISDTGPATLACHTIHVLELHYRNSGYLPLRSSPLRA